MSRREPTASAGQLVALHALSHPLRVRILDQLREPASAAEVARRLDHSRQNVNYHLKELERGGLVKRAGSRRAGGFVETLYVADTKGFIVTSAGAWPMADCDTGRQAQEDSDERPAGGSWEGAVAGVYLAAEAGLPTEPFAAVNAVRGRGLEGDRYFERRGTFSDRPGGGREVTLIELEALEALKAEAGIDLSPAAARRNVATRGVPLNHLVGRRFRIGEVVLEGRRLCEPCSHLARLTEPGVLPGLVHRGGLRADIVRGGEIRVGDPIRPER